MGPAKPEMVILVKEELFLFTVQLNVLIIIFNNTLLATKRYLEFPLSQNEYKWSYI